jgi:hypothetical protein
MADYTTPNPNQSEPQPTRLPDGMSDAAKIRAAADFEGGIEADRGDARAIDFERELRQAVSRAMAEPTQAPAGLRERILAGFDAEYTQQHGHEPDLATQPRTSQPLLPAEHKPRSTVDRRPAIFTLFPRFAAIAAVLVLSGSLIYLGSQQFSGVQPQQGQTIAASTVANQLQFVQREHNRCSDISSGAFSAKIVATGLEESQAYAQTQLGCGGPRLAQAIAHMEDAGFSLVGVGPCMVPGGGKSLHALFNPISGDSALQPVSIFLLESPGEGCKDAKPGVCYSCPKSNATGKPVMLWRDGNLMVFAHSASERSLDSVRSAYEAPETVESL